MARRSFPFARPIYRVRHIRPGDLDLDNLEFVIVSPAAYIGHQREGRIQSAERAVPTHRSKLKVTNLLSA
ncbi:MAG: hypothetical protein LC776_02995 [Acidobacteria bacterium]|nr:hypothetical protein [Acidobacteriota bacterium]